MKREAPQEFGDIIWKKANILFLAISNNFGAAPPNMSTELGFRIVHK